MLRGSIPSRKLQRRERPGGRACGVCFAWIEADSIMSARWSGFCKRSLSMTPILFHFLSCRRNWSFTVRWSLTVVGAVMLLAAGSASAAESFREERVMIP